MAYLSAWLLAACSIVSKLVSAENVVASIKLDSLEGWAGQALEVLDTEDAASATMRFTVARKVWEPERVLVIAKYVKEQLQDEAPDYSPPKDLFLRTGGAYSKRADESYNARDFVPSAADCLRALMRPGLDSTAEDVFMKKLSKPLLRMERIEEMKMEEKMKELGKYAKQQEEADAVAKEWQQTIREDEAVWTGLDKYPGPESWKHGEANSEIVGVDLDISKSGKGKGEAAQERSRISVLEGEDASHAAIHFCAVNGIRDNEKVTHIDATLHKELSASSYTIPRHLTLGSAREYAERGQSHAAGLNFGAAAADYMRAMKAKNADGIHKDELSARFATAFAEHGLASEFWQAWQDKDCKRLEQAGNMISADSRSGMMTLVMARCHHVNGKAKDALKTLTSMLNNCAQQGNFANNDTCVTAASAGSVLALRFGDIDKAKKMYQKILRFDPDQKLIQSHYKALKGYTRLLSEIEELLRSSKNHDAVKAVERTKGVLVKVMGEDGAKAAGTRLLLFECKAKSAITLHDDAIEACNTAISQFENHDNPSPRDIAEAYAWRAEANMRDRSYDDSVSDLQEALKKVPNSQDYKEKLQEAREQQDHWNKAEEQHDNRGRSIGHFSVNRPHAELLELPENIGELPQEDKCRRLKKAYHKMSLRWHPDKSRGGRKRAQRKSTEVGEAKTLLEQQFGCKRRR